MEERTRDNLLRRLRKVEGQVRGIQRMVTEDKYCVDTILQMAAVQGALGQVAKALLANHLQTCVVHAFKKGSRTEQENALAEVLELFSRYAKLGPGHR